MKNRAARTSGGLPDLTTSEFKVRAHETWKMLRADHPVQRTELPSGEAIWLVTRYEDVVRLLKDPRLSKNRRRARTGRPPHRLLRLLGSLGALERNMLDLDPPDHTRLRALVQRVFTPGRVEAMGPRIEALARELLEGSVRDGHLELIADYALALPSRVIAGMLGFPGEDHGRFHTWSSAIVSATSSPSPWRALPSLWKLVRYSKRHIAAKRRHPRDDLISDLLAVESEGQRLSADELLAMTFLLVVAGHETTTSLIANGVLTLIEHPDQLECLRKDSSLDAGAVEEMLRFCSPVEIATERYPIEPIELHGQVIPRGELVGLVLASANRDEAQFEQPDRFDIRRPPARHLAFGEGIHFCLGAALARLEARVALRVLLDHLPDLRLAVPRSEVRWRSGLHLRGLESLPLAVTQNRGSVSAGKLASPGA